MGSKSQDRSLKKDIWDFQGSVFREELCSLKEREIEIKATFTKQLLFAMLGTLFLFL